MEVFLISLAGRFFDITFFVTYLGCRFATKKWQIPIIAIALAILYEYLLSSSLIFGNFGSTLVVGIIAVSLQVIASLAIMMFRKVGIFSDKKSQRN